MKITMYELLGMVKDGKAPKKIKVTGTIYEYDEEYGFYFNKTKNGRVALGGKLNEINLIYNYNSENIVEIIEEEKKIPEKLSTWFSVETKQSKELNIEYANTNFENMYEKINSIIDYLIKSKGE